MIDALIKDQPINDQIHDQTCPICDDNKLLFGVIGNQFITDNILFEIQKAGSIPNFENGLQAWKNLKEDFGEILREFGYSLILKRH